MQLGLLPKFTIKYKKPTSSARQALRAPTVERAVAEGDFAEQAACRPQAPYHGVLAERPWRAPSWVRHQELRLKRRAWHRRRPTLYGDVAAVRVGGAEEASAGPS